MRASRWINDLGAGPLSPPSLRQRVYPKLLVVGAGGDELEVKLLRLGLVVLAGSGYGVRFGDAPDPVAPLARVAEVAAILGDLRRHRIL